MIENAGAYGVPVGESVGDASRDWRQGDRFTVDSITVTGDEGQPVEVATPQGIAMVSQSCDVVLPHRRNVQVAPLVELPAAQAAEARAGKRSQYVHAPGLGDTVFVDLDQIVTVSKKALLESWDSRGVRDDMETRRFSAGIARRFGRFAFPNDVSDAMKALRDLVQSKAGKQQSPFGQLLDDLVELRAESPDWLAEPAEVTLVLITRPGVLPVVAEDDLDEIPATVAEFRATASNAKAALNKIASALTAEKEPWSRAEKTWLWTFVAEAAAFLCEAEAIRRRGDALSKDIPSFVGEVIGADEFPLTRIRMSDVVDLDHLSVPVPLDTRSAPEALIADVEEGVYDATDDPTPRTR